MRDLKKAYILISAVFASFLALTVFYSFNEVSDRRSFIIDREMPALGMAAYSRLDNIAAFYKRAGEQLLRNNFIQNWITDGEQDVDALVAFMENIRDMHGLLDASLVSDVTEIYYGTDGRVLSLSPENKERDGWYYHYRAAVGESNIDSWYYPENGSIGLFVNIPVRDGSGKYLGVTGGGIDSTVFNRQLKSFERDWNIRIYMIRNDGVLVYATENELLRPPVKAVDSIWGLPVLDRISREKLNADGIVLIPDGTAGPVLWAGYMPEWETYLVLERDGGSVADTTRAAFLASFIPGSILSLLLYIFMIAVFRYMTRRSSASKIDELKSNQRLLSVVHFQSTMLEKAEIMLSDCGKEAASGELKDRREALELLRSSGCRVNNKMQMNIHDLLNDLLLVKSSEFHRRRIRFHSRFSSTHFIVPGNSRLISFVIEELLDKAAKVAAGESEIVLLTTDRQQKIAVDIAFTIKRSIAADFDLSLLVPVLDSMNFSLKTESAGPYNYVFHLVL